MIRTLRQIYYDIDKEEEEMENQHKKIMGYRDLEQWEIDDMNEVKNLSKEIGNLIESLETRKETDKRWIAIAKTDLQKGFMSLVRSIAKPTTF